MQDRDKNLFLEDILESVNAIKDYIKYMNFDEFINDRKVSLQLVYLLFVKKTNNKYTNTQITKEFYDV